MSRSDNYSEFKLSDFHVSIFCCNKSESGTELVEQIRSNFKDVYVQGFNTEAIFGLQHIVEALKITLEALKRGIMAANRPELDLLLRISCTTQISKAIIHAGIKSGKRTCYVMFSRNNRELIKARHYALKSLLSFDFPEFIVEPSTRDTLAAKLGLEAGAYFITNDSEFLRYLVERAALVTR